MDVIVITGMSGAGKATAARAVEECGYLVVDNLPPSLLVQLVSEYKKSGLTDRLCIVVDARSGQLIHGLSGAITELRNSEIEPKVIFLDASNSVLVSRYSESRKVHPAGVDLGGPLAGIEYERGLLQHVKTIADRVIDTTAMKTIELRQNIAQVAATDATSSEGLAVTLTSFGFKFGLPIDADLVFDVRFLRNPHYEEDLRSYDGRNLIIDEFVMKDPATGPYIDKIIDFLSFSLPRYTEEGKVYLTVAIGCTGGRHRSVVVSERVSAAMRKLGYRVVNYHRDVSK